MKAVINGPVDYSIYCQDIEFDASASTYSRSQPINFFWTVEQFNADGETIMLEEYLDLVIQPNISKVPSTLIINLTLSICDQVSSTQLKTSIKSDKSVWLVPTFGNLVTLLPSQELTLKADGVKMCGLSGAVKWSWIGKFNSTSSNILIKDLEAGVYDQSLKATVSGASTFFNFSIECIEKEPVVVLSRSSGLANYENDFEVDTYGSYDLGDSPVYVWSCFNETKSKKCLDLDGDTIVFGNNETLMISQDLLNVGDKLTIGLSISNGGGKTTSSITIQFGAYSESVQYPQSSSKQNPSRPFSLIPSGETSSRVQWVSSISLPNPTLLPLYIPSTSLSPGKSYTFKLQIDSTEYTSFTIQTTTSPVCDSKFSISSTSIDFSSGLSITSPSCYTSEDLPLAYNLNYSSPSYPKLSIKTLWPVGSSGVLLVVCDSSETCTEQTSTVSVTYEKLSDSELKNLYNTYAVNTDLVALTVVAISSSNVVPEDLYKTMLSDLETYFNLYTNSQIAVLNALAALTSPTQADSTISTNYEKITWFLENLNQINTNNNLQIWYTSQVNSNLARLKSSAKLQNSIQVLITSLQNLTSDFFPGQSLNISNPDFSFYKFTNFGDKFSNFVFNTSGRNISLPSNMPFASTDLINFYCTLFKNKGNYSDYIDLTFTKSADLVNNTLVSVPEATQKLSKLPRPITISLRYRKPVNNKWACAYLKDNEWLSSGCLFSKNDSKSVKFTTNHTSLFSVFDTSEVKLPPVQYIESSSGCGHNLNGIWILTVIFFLFIIFVPLAWYFDRVDLKELNSNNNYDNIKKCDSDPSIASPSFSEELPSNNNFSSDYAIQYKAKPQKIRKHSCKVLIEGHLLLGLPVFRTEFTRVFRLLTLLALLVFELMVEGLLMMGFEDTEDGESASDKKYFEDYKDKYFGYTIFALAIALLVQVSLVILFSLKGKMRKFGVAAGVVLVVVVILGSVAGVIIMAVKFCANWSGYWGISFLFGTIVEIVLVQSVIMVSRWGLLKCFD